MRILFARKISLILLLGIFCLSANAQRRFPRHHFDYRDFNLGFTMGLNYARYNMTYQIDQREEDVPAILERVTLIPKPGIYLGLVTNLNLHNNIDVRFLPSVSLEQRDFDFEFTSLATGRDSIARKRIENSNLNFPLVLKFKTDYYDVYRVFVQVGLQYSINLASNEKVRTDPDLLKTVSGDWSLVSSFGVDLYGERLKLSPEFRFNLGLRQLYVPKNTRFATAITDLFSQTLVIMINFE